MEKNQNVGTKSAFMPKKKCYIDKKNATSLFRNFS